VILYTRIVLKWILYNEQSRKESIAVLQCTIENGQ